MFGSGQKDKASTVDIGLGPQRLELGEQRIDVGKDALCVGIGLDGVAEPLVREGGGHDGRADGARHRPYPDLAPDTPLAPACLFRPPRSRLCSAFGSLKAPD